MAIYHINQTPEMCMVAVEKDGMALGYIHEFSKTLKICEAAVKQNRDAVQFVPPALRDQVLQPYRDNANYEISKFTNTLPDELASTPKVTPNGVKPGGLIRQYVGHGGKSRKRRKSKRTKRL